MVEVINRARANPTAEAAKHGITLNEGVPASKEISTSPKGPLAFNAKITQASENHLAWMNSASGAFSHVSKGSATGGNQLERLQYVGLLFIAGNDPNATGRNWENLAAGYPTGAAGVDKLHEILFVDKNVPNRGHRTNLMQATAKEIGIALGDTSKIPGISPPIPYGVVQNLMEGPQNGAKLTGVAIDDNDGNQFYTVGEGLGDVDVEIVGTELKTKTWAAGGYNLDIKSLTDGATYTARFTRDGKTLEKPFTHRAGTNVKVDAYAADFAAAPVVTPAPTITAFTASSSAITCGQATTLSWTTKDAAMVTLNGTDVTNAGGSMQMSPSKDTKYTLTVQNETGNASKELSVAVSLLAEFSASASNINTGDSLSLSWNVCPGATVAIAPGYANLAAETNAQGAGSLSLKPTQDTTYTLTTTYEGQTATQQVAVTVKQPVVVDPDPPVDPPVTAPSIASFAAAKSAITCGESTLLSWKLTGGATSATITGLGDVLPMTNAEGDGSIQVSPASTTQYALTVGNEGGNATASAQVRVNLIVDLSANSTSITEGDPVTLTWNVCPGATVAITPGFANLAAETNAQGAGSISVKPNTDTTYTLTTTLAGTTATAAVSIAVKVAEVTEYVQHFQAANGTTDLGDGSIISSNDGTNQVIDGALRMTQSGTGDTASSFVIPVTGFHNGWTATFDFTVTHTGDNTPADGFSFNYGEIPSGANYGDPAEEGYAAGVPHVSFQVDTWQWDDPNQDAGLGIGVNGEEFVREPAWGEYANFKPSESVSGQATISWDPVLGASFGTTGLRTNAAFTSVPTWGFSGDAAYGFSILARTGGHTETVEIDNLRIVAGSVSAPPLDLPTFLKTSKARSRFTNNPHSLYAFWEFDDIDNAFNDIAVDSVGLTVGNLAGAVLTADAGGRSGQPGDHALDVSGGTMWTWGAKEMLSLNRAQALDKVTFSFWQKLNSIADTGVIYAWADETGNAAGAEVNAPWGDGVLYFATNGCCDDTQNIGGNPPAGHDFTSGGWHHYAFVKDGPTKSVWVNGVKAFEGQNTAPLPFGFNELSIGVDYGAGPPDGLIDEVAIFASALPSEAIAQLASGAKATNLIGGGERPVISRVTGDKSKVIISLKGTAGKTYTVEHSIDMRAWTTIGSGLSGDINYEDTNAGRVGRAGGYYRVVED